MGDLDAGSIEGSLTSVPIPRRTGRRSGRSAPPMIPSLTRSWAACGCHTLLPVRPWPLRPAYVPPPPAVPATDVGPGQGAERPEPGRPRAPGGPLPASGRYSPEVRIRCGHWLRRRDSVAGSARHRAPEHREPGLEDYDVVVAGTSVRRPGRRRRNGQSSVGGRIGQRLRCVANITHLPSSRSQRSPLSGRRHSVGDVVR